MKLYGRSLYLQARDEILKLIDQNFEFMAKLPSEQELANMLGISRNTVREAIKTLESEGYVITRHGVGSFVIRKHGSIITNISNLESSTSIITKQGYEPGTVNVSFGTIDAFPTVIRELRLEEGSKVQYLYRVRTANGLPTVYVKDYIASVDNFEEKYSFKKHESIFEFLESVGHHINFSICSISAVISDADIMEKLSLKEPMALLCLKQTHYTVKGMPVLYSDSYYLCDVFSFDVIRKSVGEQK